MSGGNNTLLINEPRALIAFADKQIDVDGILDALGRGGEYIGLFLHRNTKKDDNEFSVWLNAWVVTEDHVAEAEKAEEHLQGKYFQQGFHPAYGTSLGKPFYETIYGGPAEPLVLGWSADTREVDAHLSQEFERCYNLTRRDEQNRAIWDSWKEAIDDVVIREQDEGSLSVIARRDFVEDFQHLRQRRLLVGIYAEWGDRLASATGKHEFGLKHSRGERKIHYFGVPGKSGYEYVEIQGYVLSPPPSSGFSLDFGSVPQGVKQVAERIEFQTSKGRIRPWEVREARHSHVGFYSIAIFDQNVLSRYQLDPKTEVKADRFSSFTISSEKAHLSRFAFLLGTEYVSVSVGDFVQGIPPSEWPHWQPFNTPFVGNDKHREMIQTPSLFQLTEPTLRLPASINARYSYWTDPSNVIPFKSRHNVEKDYRSLVRVLPQKVDELELIARAKALDGLIVERVSESELRAFLTRFGYPKDRAESQRSILLLSTFLMVCRTASLAVKWKRDIAESLAYAVGQVSKWQERKTDHLGTEERAVIDETVAQCEILFLVHELRLLAAHATTSDIRTSINELFAKHGKHGVRPDQYRVAILDLYRGLIDFLRTC